jgi:hypothetical protein
MSSIDRGAALRLALVTGAGGFVVAVLCGVLAGLTLEADLAVVLRGLLVTVAVVCLMAAVVAAVSAVSADRDVLVRTSGPVLALPDRSRSTIALYAAAPDGTAGSVSRDCRLDTASLVGSCRPASTPSRSKAKCCAGLARCAAAGRRVTRSPVTASAGSPRCPAEAGRRGSRSPGRC